MKVLLTGAGGLMGRYLAGEGRAREVVALSRRALDITDDAAVRETLARERPDWVINAAALCSFDRCEEDPAGSEAVNLRAAVRLAEQASRTGARVVLFSSDYIFDGEKGAPYTETDPAVPRSVYARHKAALERETGGMPGVLVARCAWIFGRGGATFMSRMPELMREREELTVAAGKRGSCLYAGYGARAIYSLLERGASGVVNLVHEGETAWEIFAEACLEEMRALKQEPRCRVIRPVPFQEMEMLKPGRPAYSVLATGRLRELLGEAPMPWREGLREFLRERVSSGLAEG